MICQIKYNAIIKSVMEYLAESSRLFWKGAREIRIDAVEITRKNITSYKSYTLEDNYEWYDKQKLDFKNQLKML